MVADNMPAAEVAIDATLVRDLLREQHRDLADLEIVELANGWDNVLFRLGRELTVRMPRRAAAAPLIENEQRWLPNLALKLPLRVPVPVRVGQPGLGYPWTWSVCEWMKGEIAERAVLNDPDAEARRLGSFLAALHQTAPTNAPLNEFRGGPLAGRSVAVAERVERLSGLIDAGRVLSEWNSVVATPVWSGQPSWLHGDLHPANILVRNGRIDAVLDFGDITSGDPATDLAVGWMLFEPPVRASFRDSYGRADDATWARARGWALHLSLAYLVGSADNPLMSQIGTRTLAAVLASPL